MDEQQYDIFRYFLLKSFCTRDYKRLSTPECTKGFGWTC